MKQVHPALPWRVSLDNAGDWAYAEKIARILNGRVYEFCINCGDRLKELRSQGRIGVFGLGILEQWAADFARAYSAEKRARDRLRLPPEKRGS